MLKLKKNSNAKLSRNFTADEFKCSCDNSSCTYTLIDEHHVAKLQVLRDHVGPIKITSGYRCDKHNAAVGGSKNSQHCLGKATDLVPLEDSLERLTQLAETLFKIGGLGRYPGQGFIHVDSRNEKARWTHRKD